MTKRGKNKVPSGAIKTVRDLERRSPHRHLSPEEMAANRRDLLKRLDPDTADMTRREFARLGLHQ